MLSTCLLRVLSAAALSGIPCLAQTSVQWIAPGSDWRYLDTGVYPGAAWTDVGFDESSWALGPAQLGYGDGDEATVVSFGLDLGNRHITTWFRHEFQANNVAQFLSLRLELLRDDGAAVYLNGVELLRSRLLWEDLTPSTLADGSAEPPEESLFHTFLVGQAPLLDGTNVLAVELHQDSPAGFDLSFDLGLWAQDFPVATRGPYLQVPTPTSMRVRWSSSQATNSLLRFGLAGSPPNMPVFDAQLTTDHDLLISGLQPGTEYEYTIGSTQDTHAATNDQSFRTPPLAGTRTAFRTWVLGDSGTASKDARAVRDAWHAFSGGAAPDLWLMLGDNAYPDGDQDDYQHAVFDTYPQTLAASPLLATRGNHDKSVPTYETVFSLPTSGEAGGLASGTEQYYSFDYANVHFVCLDSYGSSLALGAPMYTWLAADLAATTQDWIVAFWHHPPYTHGTHNSDFDLIAGAIRSNYLPLLEASGVDLVLSGHSHVYERSFLIDGHYGDGASFHPSMLVDGGDGKEQGDGAYNKDQRGAVYVVAGSSGTTREAAPGLDPHPTSYVRLDDTLGSAVLDVDGGRLSLLFLDSDGQVRDQLTLLGPSYEGQYCVGQVHSQGCTVDIQTNGVPSLSGGPFLLKATETVPNTVGLFVYGFQPANLPLSIGRLCVSGSPTRVGIQATGPGSACGGNLSFDFGNLLQSGSDPALSIGTTTYAQAWVRDPQSSQGSALSNAVQFIVLP